MMLERPCSQDPETLQNFSMPYSTSGLSALGKHLQRSNCLHLHHKAIMQGDHEFTIRIAELQALWSGCPPSWHNALETALCSHKHQSQAFYGS